MDFNKLSDEYDKYKDILDGLSDQYEKYMKKLLIPGQPDESLKDCLHKCSEELLQDIWNETATEEMIDNEDNYDREAREKYLYDAIPSHLEDNLPWIEPDTLDLFGAIMTGDQELSKNMGIFDKLIPQGWCFAYSEDYETYSYSIPEEIINTLKKLKEPEINAQFALVGMIRKIHEICVAFYGVYSDDQINTIRKLMFGEGEEPKVIQDHFDEISTELEEENKFREYKEYYVSTVLDDDRADSILKKCGDDWYHPEKDEVMRFAEDKETEYWRNEYYDTALKALSLGKKHKEYMKHLLDDISLGVIQEDWDLSDCMQCLKEEDVAFLNQQAADRFIKTMIDYYKNARCWSLGGYSRSEKGIKVTGRFATEIALENEKIYPNDPCPCGSGKKFKKCCGNVVI